MSGAGDAAIRVEHLSKVYRVYDRPADMFWELLTRRPRHKEFWALKDVSFQVRRAEVVGVVGRNGAGKSTLLRILAGTLDRSAGEVEVRGKVSAILELGTGFHPDYSGRENIYMGGMCQGMSQAEIDSKLDSIINFSELREVIDRPFRTYSSGMKGRLTFAVAIHVDPDIFIVDEALATGDARFVRKCLKRIREICDSGATVFFVSHATDLVRRLCHRALYIDQGKLLSMGTAQEVCREYDVLQLELSSEAHNSQSGHQGVRLEGPTARIDDVRPHDAAGRTTHAFFQHDPLTLAVSVYCAEPVVNPAVWVRFTRSDGIQVTSWLSHEPEPHDLGTLAPGCHTLTVTADDLMLGDGVYLLTVALFPEKQGAGTAFYTDPLCMWDGVVQIEVKRRTRPLSTLFDQPMRIARDSAAANPDPAPAPELATKGSVDGPSVKAIAA